MKPALFCLLFLLLFCNPLFSVAQVEGWIYRYDNSIKVYGFGGVEKTLAWCGGFDNPKFSMADLNKDGKQDLVVFDRNLGVRTFLNTSGANYTYAPEYELNFPPDVNYLILADYNRDGIQDLFQQGLTGVPGFDVWKGYYNGSNQLCFSHYQQLWYNNAGWGNANAYVNPSDMPAIVDMDNDGDLDFLAYEDLGQRIYYYKNVQVEEHLPTDTIKVKLKDQCWGKILQSYRLSYFLNSSCNNGNLVLGPGEKKTHSGNTICILDMDGDGDMDYLGGNVSFPNIVYCNNGRIPYRPTQADSIVNQDTTWQSSGHVLNMPTWPAIFHIDIDNDGKADLLISPNSNSENYKCIAYYKNTGTATVPVFSYQGDSFLVDKTIDLGTAAYPMFFDYNKDGKPDLFIGSDGYYQPGGTYKARISFYLNTSVAGSPSFTLQTNDFLNVSIYNFRGTSLSVGDLDNDGKKDLIIGHSDGSFSLFINHAASDAVQPDWQLSQLVLKDASNNTINVGGNAAPCIYDLDKDGKPDLLSGQYGGYIQYYQNISTTAGTVQLQKINNRIGQANADGGGGATYSCPFIGKMDTTGKDYLLVGSNSGLLYRYDGFQSGDTTAAYTLKDTAYSWLDTTFLYIRHPGEACGVYQGFRSAPAIADIDGDGMYEMVIGDVFGGVKMYKQDSTIHLNVPVIENIEVSLYPNPAKDIIYVSWNKPLAQPSEISLLNMTGQVMLRKHATTNDEYSTIRVSSLPPGLYILSFISGNDHLIKKVSIMH